MKTIELWEAGATVPEIARDLRLPGYLVYKTLLEAKDQLHRPPPVSHPIKAGGSWRKAEMVEALARGEAFSASEAKRRFGYAHLRNAQAALQTVAVQCEDKKWRLSRPETTSTD